jgi:23S rRNA (cytosine1962-C5)-methyltransferase
MAPSVSIGARGVERLRRGHLWIYRSDVSRVDAAAGDIVGVLDARGRLLARGFYSDRSQIAIRIWSADGGEEPRVLMRTRIARAVEVRRRLGIDSSAWRVVHGEGDLFPSLIVDRYGDCLVVQALSQTTDRWLPEIVEALVEVLQPRGVLARNDPRVRLLEGLEQKVELLFGEVPAQVEVTEGQVTLDVDLWRGQKTGLFLDQRENRAAAAGYAHGRLLDCFSYNGAFALQMARRCTSVVAVDVAEDATARIAANARRNGLAIEVRTANVFDELRELDRAGERFDTIVLDPPAFAKNREALSRAVAGYKEINLRALKLLQPGGVLVSCTCSYHVDEAMFAAIVSDAALDAGARVVLVEKRMQARDHPVLVGVPETSYLTCLVLRKL